MKQKLCIISLLLLVCTLVSMFAACGGGTNPNPPVVTDENGEIIEVPVEKAYKVTYVMNGGTNPASNLRGYDKGDKSFDLADASRPGFPFEGWYADADFTKPITRINTSDKCDVTVYAKWGEAEFDALLYSSNGGLGVGTAEALSRGESTEVLPCMFTRTGYQFVGWATEPEGEASLQAGDTFTLTDDSTRVLYAVWKENGSSKTLSYGTNIDYSKLYVQDGLLFAMDFFGVTEERNATNPIVGSNSYTDVTKLASSRFTGSTRNYDAFVSVARGGIAIAGGTAKVTSPWIFSDWYEDHNQVIGSGKAEDYRTSLPSGPMVMNTAVSGKKATVYYIDGTIEEFDVTTDGATTVYVKQTMVEGVTDYYIQDGKWAKKTYVSSWIENGLSLGYNSRISIDGLHTNLQEDQEDYSVQLVTSYTGDRGGQVFMLGMARIAVKPNGGNVTYSGYSAYDASSKFAAISGFSIATNGAWEEMHDNTFVFDRSYAGKNSGAYDAKIYFDGKNIFSETLQGKSCDSVIKIGEGAETNIHAIRVYETALTEAEIVQNHFADIAKFYGLDTFRYSMLNAEAQKEIQEAFREVGFHGYDRKSLQAKLDAFFAVQEIEGVSHIIYHANIGEFENVAEQYAINGYVMPTPEIVLNGSDFLGWATEKDGAVVYQADEPIVVNGSGTLYAVWKHNTYSITYDAMDGTFADGVELPDAYLSNNDFFTFPIPEREGYIFCGWYTNANYTRALDGITYGVGGNLSLYAGWQKETQYLLETNIPTEVKDISDKFDSDFTNNANVLERFYYTAFEEFAEPFTVVEPLDVNSYLASNKNQFYVAKDGNDLNSGTKEFPLASVETALAKANGLDGAIIWIRGGVYTVSNSLGINSTNCGKPTSPLIISAYGEEEVILTTAKQLSSEDFNYVDTVQDKVAARLPAESKGKVMYVNLKELGWREDEIGKLTKDSMPTLSVGGEELVIARYPNDGELPLYIDAVIEHGSISNPSGSNFYYPWMERVKSGEFDAYVAKNGIEYYTDSRGNKTFDLPWAIRMVDQTPVDWVDEGNIWYYGNVFEGWDIQRTQVSFMSFAEYENAFLGRGAYDHLLAGDSNLNPYKTLTKNDFILVSKTASGLGAKVSGNSPTGHNDYYLYNAIEALDVPGEWYYDVNTGNLYVYPTEDFDTADILYNGTTHHIMAAQYAENVILNGLTFKNGGGNAVRVDNGKNFVIQNCTFTDLQRSAVQFSNTEDSAVIYCDLSSISNGAMIAISGSEYQKLQPGRNLIQNNYFHDPCLFQQMGVQFTDYMSVVSHNFFDDTTVSLGGIENFVEYNEFDGGSRDISDGGMVYLGGLMSHGNHIRYNYMHHWNQSGNGTYFDDLSCNNYAYYNIIDTTEATGDDGAIGFNYTSSGHFNVIYGNICVGRSGDRINESAIYYSDKQALGYRWTTMSQDFVTTFNNRYDFDVLGKRLPQLMPYIEKVTQHIQDRSTSGYVRNELEIYLRAPGNQIIKNNVVLGTRVPVEQGVLKLDNSVTGKKHVSTNLIADNYHGIDVTLIFPNYLEGDFSLDADSLSEIRIDCPEFQELRTEDAGLTYELKK